MEFTTLDFNKFGNNICLICDKPKNHWIKEFFNHQTLSRDEKYIMCHASCEKLIAKIEKKRQELLQLEAELFYIRL